MSFLTSIWLEVLVVNPWKKFPKSGDNEVVTETDDNLSPEVSAPQLSEPSQPGGSFAVLRVIEINSHGALLDDGLEEPLFVPKGEQQNSMRVGHFYAVVIDKNDLGDTYASSWLDHHLDQTVPEYEVGEQVNLLICAQTELGYKAIVNDLHWGVIYQNEVFSDVKIGQSCTGYIKKIREDDRIDLYLHKPGYGLVDPLAEKILLELKNNDGQLMLSDKSSPAQISAVFGVSKKKFKMAIGSLYKAKRIVIKIDRIELV